MNYLKSESKIDAKINKLDTTGYFKDLLGGIPFEEVREFKKSDEKKKSNKQYFNVKSV